MILAGKYGSISSDTSLKPLQSSRSSRLKLKKRVGNMQRYSGHMEEENIVQKNLQIPANHKE
jgi:hypothetical protein